MRIAAGENAVDNENRKLQRSCWRANITRVANSVAANSDPRLVGNHFWGPIFAHDLVLRDLSAVVEGDIVVADDAESLSPLDALVLGNFRSFYYYLEKSYQLVGIICVPILLVLGVALQLGMLNVFACDVFHDRHGPFKEEFAG